MGYKLHIVGQVSLPIRRHDGIVTATIAVEALADIGKVV